MTIWDDHYASLYDPTLGMAVIAELLPGNGGEAVEVSVIDKRAGIEMDLGEGVLSSLKPAVDIRLSELEEKSITTDRLRGGTLTISDTIYRITSWHPRPGPQGHPGEVRMILQGKVGP